MLHWFLERRLGAGRLDAGKAVKKAAAFNCNDAATRTLFISGVELNTICKPGIVSGLKPKLKPIIINKTSGATYSYRWISLFGNTAKLDDSTNAEPTIVSATGNVAFFNLDVTENISVSNQGGRQIAAPKVASRQVRFTMLTSGYELAMRDSYLDMMDNPNSQADVDPREWNIWESPDLWNRQQKDGSRIHQNPEYFNSTNDSNFMYVRIRNVGCAVSPTYDATNKIPRLKIYWSKGSTGQNWDTDWKTTNVADTNNAMTQPGGREITGLNGIPIPAIAPGDTLVLAHGWRPPKPQNYFGRPSQFDACGLARIEMSATAPYGMAINEDTSTTASISGNLKKNNRIVMHNMVFLNWNTANRTPQLRQFDFANGSTVEQAFSLELFNERVQYPHLSGNLAEYMTLTLHLGELYDRWVQGGAVGSGFVEANEVEKTISYMPGSRLRLENLVLHEQERFLVDISFEPDPDAAITDPVDDRIIVRQMTTAVGDIPEDVYGSISYILHLDGDAIVLPARKAQPTEEQSLKPDENGLLIYPNPTDAVFFVEHNYISPVEWRLTDVMGREVKRGQFQESRGRIEVGSLTNGIYMLQLKVEGSSAVMRKIIKQ